MNAHGSIFHNSQKVERTGCPPPDDRINKRFLCACDGIPCGNNNNTKNPRFILIPRVNPKNTMLAVLKKDTEDRVSWEFIHTNCPGRQSFRTIVVSWGWRRELSVSAGEGPGSLYDHGTF